MTAPAFLAPNALVAAFPVRRREISIRAQEAKERASAKRAAAAAAAAKLAMWDGTDGRCAFTVVTTADRARLNSAPVILLAKRRSTGLIAGVRAFEAADRALLNAWIDRAAAVADIELQARFFDEQGEGDDDHLAVLRLIAQSPAL